MDPLSDVLSLLKPRSYVSAGFDAGGKWSIQFSNQHERIKCYAVVSGECWLSVEGVPDAVRLKTGDCFVLPSGRPFRLASDMTLTPVDAGPIFLPRGMAASSRITAAGISFLSVAASPLVAIMPASCWGCCRPLCISRKNRTRQRFAGL